MSCWRRLLRAGDFLFPSLNIRAVSLGGAGVTWEGVGVPAGEVPYGLFGMMMGVRGGVRLHPARGLAEEACEGLR